MVRKTKGRTMSSQFWPRLLLRNGLVRLVWRVWRRCNYSQHRDNETTKKGIKSTSSTQLNFHLVFDWKEQQWWAYQREHYSLKMTASRQTWVWWHYLLIPVTKTVRGKRELLTIIFPCQLRRMAQALILTSEVAFRQLCVVSTLNPLPSMCDSEIANMSCHLLYSMEATCASRNRASVLKRKNRLHRKNHRLGRFSMSRG